MPFAGDVGVIAVVFEHGGDGHHIVVQHPFITRPALMRSGHRFRHVAHAIAMIVDPGHQHRACRRTSRHRMEIGKPRALAGEGIEVRRRDLAAKRTDVGQPPVIG